MIIARRWLDSSGRPHTELATWLPAQDGDDRGRVLELPSGAYVLEGDPAELASPRILVALVDPAPGLDALGADRSAIYSIELPEGVAVASPEDFAGAEEAQAAAVAEASRQAAVDQAAADAERDAPRRAALAKLADSADLSADERAALLGEAG